MSETEEIVAADVDHLIAQAERRQTALREQLRVAVQNWEVFQEDYTAHLTVLSQAIETNGKTLHRLHSMKLGRTDEPPMGPTVAKQERNEEQERLKAIWEGDGKGPPTNPTRTVVPPPEAVVGEAFTTWTYKPPRTWLPADKIDENNVRHVKAVACPEGHYNPLAMPDEKCLTCGKPVDLSTGALYHLTYSMETGKELQAVCIRSAEMPLDKIPDPNARKEPGPTDNGVTS